MFDGLKVEITKVSSAYAPLSPLGCVNHRISLKQKALIFHPHIDVGMKHKNHLNKIFFKNLTILWTGFHFAGAWTGLDASWGLKKDSLEATP